MLSPLSHIALLSAAAPFKGAPVVLAPQVPPGPLVSLMLPAWPLWAPERPLPLITMNAFWVGVITPILQMRKLSASTLHPSHHIPHPTTGKHWSQDLTPHLRPANCYCSHSCTPSPTRGGQGRQPQQLPFTAGLSKIPSAPIWGTLMCVTKMNDF